VLLTALGMLLVVVSVGLLGLLGSGVLVDVELSLLSELVVGVTLTLLVVLVGRVDC
jgi:hypothetical protein